MKRWMVAVTILIFAGILSSCGNNAGPVSPTGDSLAQNEASASVKAPTATGHKIVIAVDTQCTPVNGIYFRLVYNTNSGTVTYNSKKPSMSKTLYNQTISSCFAMITSKSTGYTYSSISVDGKKRAAGGANDGTQTFFVQALSIGQ